MPTPNRATRSTSKVGAILPTLFLVAMLLPGAVLAATVTFSTQPAGATGGLPFTTQPKVTLADATTGTVSLAIGTNPSAGTLSGCAAIHDTTTGTFTFNGCKIDKAGVGYRLVATWSVNPAVTATSAAFDVVPGAKDRLGFVTQPARGVPSIAFAQQPVVAIQDNQGNTVTGDNTTVVTLTASSGGLTCTGTTSRTVSGGLATFTGCSLPTAGVSLTLSATSSPSFTGATSSQFDVADRLAFATQPSSGTAGVALTTQPVVEVRAGSSTKASNDSGTPVTLSIASGPSGAILTCSPNPVTASTGSASFASSSCKLDKAGTYTLLASAPNLASATSSSFTIAAGSAAKLGFTAQPATATSSQAFAIQPVVAVQDLGGNTVTSGTNSTATVTLAIGTNPASGTLTCTEGLTRNAVAGVATFSGCQINNAGAGYTLTASASGLTGATSTAFTVGAPAASITLTTSAPMSNGGWPTITWQGGILLTTQFGTNGGNKTFKLQATRDNVTWFDIGPLLTTDTAGRNVFAFRPSTNFFYRAVFAGTPDLAAGTSASVRTVVRQTAILRPTNRGAVRSISRNTSVSFFTLVRPSRPELTPATVTFYFYRLSGSTWVLSTQRTVTAAADGRAATTFKFSTAGQWYVRSRANPTPYNANSVLSSIERYSVN